MRIGKLAVVVTAGAVAAAAFAVSSSGPGSSGRIAGAQAPSVGLAARPFIKHVVVIVMENRSFDNLFSGSTATPQPGHTIPPDQPLPYHGAASAVPSAIAPFMKTVRIDDPSADNTHNAWACLNESTPGKPRFSSTRWIAVSQHASDPAAVCSDTSRNYDFFEFVPQSQRTIYWQIANAYGLGDRFFAATTSASYPPHQFIVAGDASFMLNGEQWVADQPNPGNGCWGPKQGPYSVPVVGPSVFEINASVSDRRGACYDRPTYGDGFNAAHTSWTHYTTAIPTPTPGTGSATEPPAVHAFDGFTNIVGWYHSTIPLPQKHFVKTTQILDDAKNGQLPQFAWVKPPCAKQSDHPGNGAGLGGHNGPNWVGTVINAIGRSREWNSTAIFVIWDDWGGFYDHVIPPTAPPSAQLGRGVRIPFLVISPYLAHPGHVVHTVGHPGSIMRFANELFGAAGLTDFDETAPDLTGWFDFHPHMIAHPFVPIAGALGPGRVWENDWCAGSSSELVD